MNTYEVKRVFATNTEEIVKLLEQGYDFIYESQRGDVYFRRKLKKKPSSNNSLFSVPKGKRRKKHEVQA